MDYSAKLSDTCYSTGFINKVLTYGAYRTKKYLYGAISDPDKNQTIIYRKDGATHQSERIYQFCSRFPRRTCYFDFTYNGMTGIVKSVTHCGIVVITISIEPIAPVKVVFSEYYGPTANNSIDSDTNAWNRVVEAYEGEFSEFTKRQLLNSALKYNYPHGRVI